MELNVIYEDKNFLVINKPAGIVVHPDEHHKTETLVQFLAKKYPEIENVGGDPSRPGLVHRLDKDTSGLLIIAKDQKSFEYLKSVFQKREVKKTYLVLVSGNVKTSSGIIDLPIGRSRKDSQRRIAGRGASGKLREAVTEYKVVKRFEKFTLLETRLITGRTHQIRAHFAAISRPVACDKIYGGKNLRHPPFMAEADCPAGLVRQFLHAWKLELVSSSGARMSFGADLRKDLGEFLRFQNKKINTTSRP